MALDPCDVFKGAALAAPIIFAALSLAVTEARTETPGQKAIRKFAGQVNRGNTTACPKLLDRVKQTPPDSDPLGRAVESVGKAIQTAVDKCKSLFPLSSSSPTVNVDVKIEIGPDGSVRETPKLRLEDLQELSDETRVKKRDLSPELKEIINKARRGIPIEDEVILQSKYVFLSGNEVRFLAIQANGDYIVRKPSNRNLIKEIYTHDLRQQSTGTAVKEGVVLPFDRYQLGSIVNEEQIEEETFEGSNAGILDPKSPGDRHHNKEILVAQLRIPIIPGNPVDKCILKLPNGKFLITGNVKFHRSADLLSPEYTVVIPRVDVTDDLLEMAEEQGIGFKKVFNYLDTNTLALCYSAIGDVKFMLAGELPPNTDTIFIPHVRAW